MLTFLSVAFLGAYPRRPDFSVWLVTWLTYGVRSGLTQHADGRLLYVSRGTGTWGPPMRLFAAPEITLFTISSENK